MIDIDRLKVVNDAGGHAAGDALLRDVSRAVIATLRGYDITVRWGGDEFVCALSDVDLATASERIVEIRAALDEMHPGASISAGLADLRPGDTLEAVIGRADEALYDIKRHRAR
jgi:diguanylate cyclase (GGDEF)-like protein